MSSGLNKQKEKRLFSVCLGLGLLDFGVNGFFNFGQEFNFFLFHKLILAFLDKGKLFLVSFNKIVFKKMKGSEKKYGEKEWTKMPMR